MSFIISKCVINIIKLFILKKKEIYREDKKIAAFIFSSPFQTRTYIYIRVYKTQLPYRHIWYKTIRIAKQ